MDNPKKIGWVNEGKESLYSLESFIGIADGSNTSVKSDLTLFCKIGWMKSGIMLRGLVDGLQ
jgi:hypothetical protein